MPTTDPQLIEQYYQALLARDSQFSGVFYVGVKTTGVFCLATCRARKPRKENVTFYASAEEATRHGYRPCKICHPLASPGGMPADIRDLLQRLHHDPGSRITDEDLRAWGLMPSRVRRWFLRHHGVTFHAYQRQARLGVALSKVQRGTTVTTAAFEAGYDSLSGFTESFKMQFGTAPTHSIRRQVISLTRLETPLGPLVAGAVAEGICLLEFADRKMLPTEFKDLARLLNAELLPGENAHFPLLRQEIAAYFSGELRAFTVPLQLPGTAFQRQVWQQLQAVPHGATCSYAQLAAALGRPTAARAVAAANGSNRVALLVPCHRIIGADGALTGYGGGVWRKKWLLELEAAGT